MYNEEKKVAFVAASYPENKREEMLGLFRLFSSCEEKWKTDFLLQPVDRLQPAFNQIAKTIAAKKAKALLAAMKKYHEWYMSEQKVDAVYAGVLLLKINAEEKLRYSMVVSPRHLQLILDEVFESPERETVDCVYRGYMWLAYAGVPRQLAPQITVNEVDFYRMVIRHSGKEYKIPAEGLREIQLLCELGDFLVVHEKPNWEKRCPRVEGDQLLRWLSGTTFTAERISNAIAKVFLKSEWSLNDDDVLLSGLFCEKFALERYGLDVTFEEEVAQRLEAMTELSKPAISNNRSLMNNRYVEKYTQWKNIFCARPSD